MDPDRSDAELVCATRAGSHDAYRVLVSRYQGHVYGLAYSLVGGGAAAPLERAARRYGEIAEEVLGQEGVTKVAPMPWMLPAGDSWTREQREREARLLERAGMLEREALAEIEGALRTL